ncbi:MAG: hypothetical protein J7J11_00815 [Desulfurococcales archaeon]|nr:hypothetical protein [Desulfurococcales archaeon]
MFQLLEHKVVEYVTTLNNELLQHEVRLENPRFSLLPLPCGIKAWVRMQIAIMWYSN